MTAPRQPCPVAAVEALIVSVPAVGNAFAEGSEETLLVKVTDVDGRVGIGESVCTPAVTKAMIDQRTIHFWSQGITDVVVGADPIEAAALYDRAYHGSFYHGRRGTYIQAYSAVDIALYDLAGRQLGLPVYKLLGGARTDRIRPYATCYPGDIYDGPMNAVLDEVTRQATVAADQGLTAVKVPVLFGAEVSDGPSCFVGDCGTGSVSFTWRLPTSLRLWDLPRRPGPAPHRDSTVISRKAAPAGTNEPAGPHAWARVARPGSGRRRNSAAGAGKCGNG